MSTTTSASSLGTVTMSGFYSGMDTEGILTKIKAASEIPITNLESQSTVLSNQSSAYGFISSSLSTLISKLDDLKDPQLYRGHTASITATTVGTASADETAANGTYDISVTQVATSSSLRSGTGAITQMAAIPAATASIASVTGMDVTNKTFTINGKTITLTGSEAIDDGTAGSVIGKINASGAGVTATYDAATGKFNLTSASTIVLGTGADTSNFLRQAQLFNNGTSTVQSSIGIARTNATVSLSAAGLATTPTTGNFYVNGTAITYSSGDTLNDILTKITNSSAGVVATYDSYTDRITLTSSKRGAQGISVTDGTSNLGSALRLTSTDSTFSIGKSTKFTVGNDPTVRQSEDETLTADELGIKGVSMTAIGTGSTQITVASDTTAVATAINEFIAQYNSAQNMVASYIKVDTDDTENSGVLSTDSTLTFLPSDLRSVLSTVMSGNSSIKMLSDLGIETNSSDNTITTVDSTKLKNAMTNNLEDVIALFTDSTNSISAKMLDRVNAYADSTSGSIALRKENLTSQQKSITDNITQMQARVDAEIAFLRSEFADMEAAYNSSQNVLSTLLNNT